ncbi:T9SS type A sorting domain-containing protein [Labilibacter sediminis]|nr:T9SS type A sorting domain-containing protein [Labilibacter sediminis]
MKRFVYYIILLFSMLAFSFKVSASVGLRIANNSGYVGDTLLIAINTLSSVTDSGIYAYQLELNYSPNYFKPIGVSTSGTLSESWGDPQMNIYDTGKLRLSAAGVAALEGQGTLVYIKFKLMRVGNVYITFSNTSYNMLNEGDPQLTLENGRINIVALPFITVTPNQGVIPIGGTMQFYSAQGVAPYTYSVTDNSVASISSTGLLTGLKRGKVYVVSTDQNNVSDSTNSQIEVVPFSMVIRDTSHYQNQKVSIPVNISSLDVEEVVSGNVTINYNKDVLQAEDIITEGTLLHSAGVEFYVSGSGKVTVSFAQDSPVTGQGVLFYVRFQIANRSSGATHLNFSDVIFNEELFSVFDHGYFRILALPPLNVTPKTGTLMTGEQLDFSVSGGTAPYVWSVSSNNYASINSDGLLTALSGGDVVVSAQDVYGAFGSSNVVSIYDAVLTVAHVEAPIDAEEVVVPIHISALEPGKEIISFSGEVQMVPNKTNNFELDKVGSISETWASASNTADDKFKFAMAGISGSLGDALLASLNTTFAEGAVVGNTIQVNINDVVANEGSPRLLVNHGSIKVTQSTGIEDTELAVLSVFPNPTDGVVWFTSETLISRVVVYSITGVNVHTFLYQSPVRSGELDCSSLSGMYLLQFYTDDGHLIYKKIKVN